MKVLWISPTSANYQDSDIGSGGWIKSLQVEVEKIHSIELAVTFIHNSDSGKIIKNGTTYYPIKTTLPKSFLGKLYECFVDENDKRENDYLKKITEIIADYNPDIIHIWGIEHFYCQIVKLTNIPCVVHIQGIASSIVNTALPPGISIRDIKKNDGLFDLIFNRGLFFCHKMLVRKMKIEKDISPHVKYWMGRTEWDKDTISILSPSSQYFHCDEVMRQTFEGKRWSYRNSSDFIIHSTIGNSTYKGVDVVLKTAEILKNAKINFQWNVCGVERTSKVVKLFSKKFNINPDKNNIVFKGTISPNKLTKLMLESDVYVHPSYIESGSNAISEAQLIGVPVIAMYIGGLPTTLNNHSGMLVQANDPWIMASKVISMKDAENATFYSNNGKKEALRRHDKEKIVQNVCNIYSKIINEQ